MHIAQNFIPMLNNQCNQYRCSSFPCKGKASARVPPLPLMMLRHAGIKNPPVLLHHVGSHLSSGHIAAALFFPNMHLCDVQKWLSGSLIGRDVNHNPTAEKQRRGLQKLYKYVHLLFFWPHTFILMLDGVKNIDESRCLTLISTVFPGSSWPPWSAPDLWPQVSYFSLCVVSSCSNRNQHSLKKKKIWKQGVGPLRGTLFIFILFFLRWLF